MSFSNNLYTVDWLHIKPPNHTINILLFSIAIPRPSAIEMCSDLGGVRLDSLIPNDIVMRSAILDSNHRDNTNGPEVMTTELANQHQQLEAII